MIRFVCECGKELQLRHDCKNGVFHFAHAEEFDDYDDGIEEFDVSVENDYGLSVLQVPKIKANGNVSLCYMDVIG